MQYLSEFEILSEPIVPQNLAPGVALPFVAQGYFLLVSRLADAVTGDLNLRLSFFPSAGFPPAGSLLVDFEDGAGANQIIALAADGSVSVPIGSGKTVLFGLQPNVVNTAADGPLGTGIFGTRGYVVIDAGPGSPVGTFQLAVVPEIRSTFFSVKQQGGAPVPDFAGASEVAYVLPTASGPLLTVTKSKETKEKDKDKEASKENKDIKDRKDAHPDKQLLPEKIQPDKLVAEHPQVQSAPGIAELSQRLAALEEAMGVGRPFITGDQRPKVG